MLPGSNDASLVALIEERIFVARQTPFRRGSRAGQEIGEIQGATKS
jgi:hypothetical protein